MKIFISWSGERSRIIAEGLNDWLPKVIQAVKPFYSPEIEKGTKGIEEINKNLEGTSFGIICLTPDNLKSEWIHYESGALSKIEGARIWTLLYNLKHSDIVQPLAQFQHTLAKKTDVYKLLDSINAKLPQPLEKSILSDSFDRWWSDFEGIVKKADETTDENNNDKVIRTDRDVLNEILELTRNQQNPILYNQYRISNAFRGIPEEIIISVSITINDLKNKFDNFTKFAQKNLRRAAASVHTIMDNDTILFSFPEGITVSELDYFLNLLKAEDFVYSGLEITYKGGRIEKIVW
jgi:hypothetical protein